MRRSRRWIAEASFIARSSGRWHHAIMNIKALILALPLLAACTTLPGAVPDLSGTKWAFTVIDGARPVSTAATLSFESNQLSANVGCNGMGGEWRIEQDRIIADQLIGTQMYCEGLMEQESAVAALLGGKPRVTMAGDRLVLRSAAHSAELQRVE
jgi:heat shock protein HslJ